MAWLETNLPSRWSGPASWIYIGGITGLFECALVYGAILLWPPLTQAAPGAVVAFGLGFGGAEAAVLRLVQQVSLAAQCMGVYTPDGEQPVDRPMDASEQKVLLIPMT